MSHGRLGEKVQDGGMVARRSLPVRAALGDGGPRAEHGPGRRRASLFATGLGIAAAIAACGGGGGGEGSSSDSVVTTIPIVQLTVPAGATTTTSGHSSPSTTTTTTIVIGITISDITVAPAVSVPVVSGSGPSSPTTVATGTCSGITNLPADAVTGDQLVGDLDGDRVDDTVTAYTAADGTAHVFLQRGNANASDVTVALAGASMVSLSWEDVDHSLGAVVAAPKVVMAIGRGPAGSAAATFLSPNRASGSARCITQWTVGPTPFTFPIDQRGPFSGLLCDGAAGRRYYVLRTGAPDGVGSVVVTSREIDHDGTVVTLSKLGDETIPHDVNVQRNIGDIQNCDHPPLFANFPIAAVPATTTTTAVEATSTTGG